MGTLLRILLPLCLLGLSFFGGVFVGKHRTCSYDPRLTFENRKEFREKMLDRLTERLALDQRQRAAIEEIFTAKQSQMKELRMQIRPQFRKLKDDTHRRVAEILTPEQKVLFEEHLAERRARRKQRGHPPRWFDTDANESAEQSTPQEDLSQKPQ